MFKLWSRRDVSYETWWAELKPLLAADAQVAYEYTDPRNIPPMKVTGRGKKVEPFGDPSTTASVEISTSIGPFVVHLGRQHGELGGPWLMHRIGFPPGVQG